MKKGGVIIQIKIKEKRYKSNTPMNTGMKVTGCISAMYQIGQVNKQEKKDLSDLVLSGMKAGDFTKLADYVAGKKRAAAPGDLFYSRIEKLLTG